MPVKWNKGMLRDGLIFGFLLLCGIGLILYSRPVSAAVTETVTLCLEILLPTLYPFFILSSLLVSTGALHSLSPLLDRPCSKLLGLPGYCGIACILGFIGGYPVGARTVVLLYRQGNCSKEESLSALRFCNNAGPAFLISAVGVGLLHEIRLGVFLYSIHLISAVMIGILFRSKQVGVKDNTYTPISDGTSSALSIFLRAVTNAFSTFLNVCAFVLFFSVLLCLLQQHPLYSLLLSELPGNQNLWKGILAGVLELTAGTAALSNANLPRQLLLPALSGLCGWGGLSVQFQTIQILQEAELPCRDYVFSKLLHGMLAAGLTWLICL